jgi:hypothetical protein
MTVNPLTVSTFRFVVEHLERAEPDRLRSMLSSFILGGLRLMLRDRAWLGHPLAAADNAGELFTVEEGHTRRAKQRVPGMPATNIPEAPLRPLAAPDQ